MKQWLCVGMAFLIASCDTSSNVRETLGLNRSAPDEFKVVSRPPLSVPPEFNLRPPEPGAPPRAVTPAEEEAAGLLLRGDGNEPGLTHSMAGGGLGEAPARPVATATDPVLARDPETPAESLFMRQTGIDHRDVQIRSKLYQEKDEVKPMTEAKYGIQQIFGIEASDEVIDPYGESERIRKNLDEDKPVNEGEVKTMEDANPGGLEMLF